MKPPGIILLSLILIFNWLSSPAQLTLRKGGHSHNDYYQKRPLLDALDAGMASIEADVFLRQGKILVGHTPSELNEDRSLTHLYLEPLFRYFQQAPQEKPVILMIDIKDRGEATYLALQEVIRPYTSILSHLEGNQVVMHQVTLILSGDRPFKAVAETPDRYFFLDGRLDDLDLNQPSALYPLISDNWNKYFKWRGEGRISEEEKDRLLQVVQKTHEQNKMIRFWGMPTDPSAAASYWKLFKEVGIDLIVTDCPACFTNMQSP